MKSTKLKSRIRKPWKNYRWSSCSRCFWSEGTKSNNSSTDWPNQNNLRNEDQIKAVDNRIADLEQEEKTLAQQIADVESSVRNWAFQ
jgi:hypothetical protein